LHILEKKGLVSTRVTKAGARPERVVYCLTTRGQERFQSLLMKSLLDFKRPEFSLDLSLYFLHYMKPGIARRRLRARMQLLKRLSGDLARMAEALKKRKSTALSRIVEHNLRMVEAESRFLNYLVKTL
jgi:DNA-binding PadR family transcriptional regulator